MASIFNQAGNCFCLSVSNGNRWLNHRHLEMDSFVLPLAADQPGFGAILPVASSADVSGAPMPITGQAGTLFQGAEAKPDSLRSLDDYTVTQFVDAPSTRSSSEPDFSTDDDLSVLANHASQLRENMLS